LPRIVTRPEITPEGLKMRGLKNMARPPAVGNEEGVVVYVRDPATQNLIARQSARKHLLRRDMELPAKVRSRKELKCRLPPPGGKDVNIGMYGPGRPVGIFAWGCDNRANRCNPEKKRQSDSNRPPLVGVR